jgi:L-amino acid N-acyltransferase YncA
VAQHAQAPHLVADRGGRVVGYAYAVVFRKRPAYR